MKKLLALVLLVVLLFVGAALCAIGQAYVDQLYEQESTEERMEDITL